MSCKVCQIGYRGSSMDWLMKVFQNIDTLPVLLMNYLWDRKQKWYRVSTALRLYSLPEGPTLRHLLENQDYEGFLQKTHWYSRAQSGQFW